MTIEARQSPVADRRHAGRAAMADRRRIADRIFRGALAFNTFLTLFWGFMMVTRHDALIFHQYTIDRTAVASIFFSLIFFYVIWGYIWYGDQESRC